MNIADNLDDLEDLPSEAPTAAELTAEAQEAGAADPIARHELAYLTAEKIADAATWRDGVEASAHRAGFDSIAEYIDLVDPLPERAWPIVPRASMATEPDLPDLADAALLSIPPDVDAWYIVGLIRPGKLMYLASGEGVGKSSVRKEVELRLADGHGSLFGHYPIAGPVRVGTIDEENGPDEEWRREEELLPRLELVRADLAGRYFRGSFLGLNLNTPQSQAYIRRQVAKFALDVLFLDTGGSMVDEEYGAPLKGAVRFLRSLIREFPALSIVVCVHMVKPPRGPNIAAPKRRALTDVMGQWTRQADVVAVMTDLGNDRVRWELVKRRGVPKSAGILDYSDGLTRWVADADEAVDPASTGDTIRTLRCIAAGAGTWEQVKEATGIGRNKVFAAISGLRADGLIGPGLPYRMTADGQEALE
jgi:hypothetical protein